MRLAALPAAKGACFSCGAAFDIAEHVVEAVGRDAVWCSIGLLSNQRQNADRYVEFCTRNELGMLFHPVELDVCGTDPLDLAQLRALRELADLFDTPWLNTDLAMWTQRSEALLEGLVPMPLIPQSVHWTAERVKRAQDVLGRPIAIENAPYLWYMGDGDILQLMSAIAEEADCLMTLDVGHLYAARVQHGRAPQQPGDDDIAWHRVVEAHLSGTYVTEFADGKVVIDDVHDTPVAAPVWELAGTLLPKATNLRAVMAEAEGMPAPALAASVRSIAHAMRHTWGLLR